MNPLFFGTSERPLFGVYHPPRTRDSHGTGVVLCYPAGQEYMRAHRAFRQLAVLLSRNGFAVLRFDYFGTGDSAGEPDAVTFDEWARDIETAVDELKDTAAVGQVHLIGLRLGAYLAAVVQARRPDVCQTILWDPVVEGTAYLLNLLNTTDKSPDENAAALRDQLSTIGINGFPWTAQLRAELTALRPARFPLPPSGAVRMVTSVETPEYAELRSRYEALQLRFSYECIPGPNDWEHVDAYGSALLPQDIIQGIVSATLQGQPA